MLVMHWFCCRHIVELNTTSVHVVTEHFRRLKVGFNGNHPGNATWDHLAVHHYLTKSRCAQISHIMQNVL